MERSKKSRCGGQINDNNSYCNNYYDIIILFANQKILYK